MCLAVPGKIVQIEERDLTRMGKVDFGGVVKDVCLAYLPDASVGDYTIVHVGFAIQRLDEESALATLRLFEELGVLDQELGDPLGDAARHGTERREVPRRVQRPRCRAAAGGRHRGDRDPAAGRSWRCAAGRRTRSSVTASTSCCPRPSR